MTGSREKMCRRLTSLIAAIAVLLGVLVGQFVLSSQLLGADAGRPDPLTWQRVSFDGSGNIGTRLVLRGDVIVPAGPGPFPAVVLLPGCSGIWKPWSDPWARLLRRWGYIVMEVDSLTPRGFTDGICDRDGAVGAHGISEDAHAAKRYLKQLPTVDPDRIAVMGMSGGGEAAIWAAQNSFLVDGVRPDPFRAAVGLYPYCSARLHRVDAPILILSGDLDDWTPPARCRQLLDQRAGGTAVSLKIYPGATHAFDVDLPDREYLGHTMRYDPAAAADARRRIRKFLAEHVRSQ